MHERIRDRFLGLWGLAVTAHPWITLSLAIAIAAAAILLTVRKLEFHADRSNLVDPNLSWNKRYAGYKRDFPHWDDVIVVIEGDADNPHVEALVRKLATALRTSPRVRSADAGFEAEEVGPQLFRAAPEPQFRELIEHFADARQMIQAENANAALALMLSRLGEARGEAGSLDELVQLLAPYLEAMEGDEPDFAYLKPDAPNWLPLVSEAGSGRLRFVYVQFAHEIGSINDLSVSIAWLRQEIGAHIAEHDIDGLTWGVTGIPAIEADETAQSITDSTRASILAFALITILLVLVFRGVVVPLLAAASLLIGLAWSFGWLVISVGHLQLLSTVFSVILLGLGVDFAIHFVARLELVRDKFPDLPTATSRVFRGVGPGMITGAVTTAAAFGATALTEFKGMAEMGIIAGGGILLCLIAVLSCFPAGLAATRRWKSVIRARPGGETAHFAHGRFDTIDFHPIRSLLVALLLVAGIAMLALRVRYDPNVLNLHPPGIESVVWERRIVEDDARSVWAAIVLAPPQQVPELADRLRALDVVSDVGAMGMLFPRNRDERTEAIADLRERAIAAPLDIGADANTLLQQFAALRLGLQREINAASVAERAQLSELNQRLGRALSSFAAAEVPEQAERMERLNDAFRRARVSLADWLDRALAPGTPRAEDLPDVLRERWVGFGEDGREEWLIQVYPQVDPAGRSILSPERLEPFVESLQRVVPTVLGPPVQIYESSELIKHEYLKACAYAIAAILILLALDFRSIADPLCAMVPVTVGFVGAFGLMGAFGVPLNFANIIVMPLIFGIGVDAGVHMVHRWQVEPLGRPAGLSGGTGRGISLTMITTMIGFGSMLIAEHRGIRSLGFVMVTGLFMTLMACYAILPAILRLRTPHWSNLDARQDGADG